MRGHGDQCAVLAALLNTSASGRIGGRWRKRRHRQACFSLRAVLATSHAAGARQRSDPSLYPAGVNVTRSFADFSAKLGGLENSTPIRRIRKLRNCG